jgi:hypothetical protein
VDVGWMLDTIAAMLGIDISSEERSAIVMLESNCKMPS